MKTTRPGNDTRHDDIQSRDNNIVGVRRSDTRTDVQPMDGDDMHDDNRDNNETIDDEMSRDDKDDSIKCQAARALDINTL